LTLIKSVALTNQFSTMVPVALVPVAYTMLNDGSCCLTILSGGSIRMILRVVVPVALKY
jgi:hypothetical protein